MNAPKSFDENSPSVQGHLATVQGVINRMATNSTSAKAWCVSLVAAILVLVGDHEKPALLWIAAIPTLLFFWLDAYYLMLEQGFRRSYGTFVTRLHDGTLAVNDLYEIRPTGTGVWPWFKACVSPSILPVYIVLGGMIVITRYLIAPG